MSTYDVGQQLRITETFKASDGTPTNPTVVILTIVAPDGTTTTPTPVAEGSGVYHHDLTFTQSGEYTARWAGTGTVVASSEATYTVRPQGTIVPAIDATIGTTTANSYLTLAAAATLAADDIGPAAADWLMAGPADQARALKRATREVDAHLRSSGLARYTATQALLYPRAIDVSAGVAFIPRWIAGATFAQAKHLLRNAAVLDAAQTRKARAMTSASEPNTSYAADPSPTRTNLCDEALGYLASTSAGAATISSVRIGTDYSYPVTGTDTSELLP